MEFDPISGDTFRRRRVGEPVEMRWIMVDSWRSNTSCYGDLLKFMLVCSQWRDAAQSSPTVWSTIIVILARTARATRGAQAKIVDKTSSGKPRIEERAEDLEEEDGICAVFVFTPLRMLEAIIPGLSLVSCWPWPITKQY